MALKHRAYQPLALPSIYPSLSNYLFMYVVIKQNAVMEGRRLIPR